MAALGPPRWTLHPAQSRSVTSAPRGQMKRDEEEVSPGPSEAEEGIVLLELMGGVLPASHILREWGMTPEATYYSEIDEGAIRVAKKEFPEATNLGPVQDIGTPLLGHDLEAP